MFQGRERSRLPSESHLRFKSLLSLMRFLLICRMTDLSSDAGTFSRLRGGARVGGAGAGAGAGEREAGGKAQASAAAAGGAPFLHLVCEDGLVVEQRKQPGRVGALRLQLRVRAVLAQVHRHHARQVELLLACRRRRRAAGAAAAAAAATTRGLLFSARLRRARAYVQAASKICAKEAHDARCARRCRSCRRR